VRAENHAAANGVLIDAQAQIPIARAWGGGLLASVDGLRFVVPVRTINAGPSPKYFGYKRGITWLNAANDQVAGIGQMVVPGTPRDSLFILDTLLNLEAGPKPEVVATDNASYSDMVFGVFAILNYRFAPRFADLPDQRYWRAPLPEPLPANVDLSPEQQAIGGYGPLEPIARNTVNRQLTVQESRHRLGRKICHGHRGQIRQAYREGQPDPAGLSRRPRRSARRPRPGPQRRRAVEYPLPRRHRREPARQRPARARRGCRPAAPARARAPQLPGSLRLYHPAACRAAAAARPERTRWRGRRRVLTSPARASRRGTCDLSWPGRADVTGTGDGRHGRESRFAAMLDL
jgi:hypothetical protein